MPHRDYMLPALEQARLAAREDEVPVGAVVVRRGEIIAAAHNRTEQSGDATAHAELLALRAAAEKLGGWRLSGCALYVTLEPCAMCVGAMLNCHLGKLVFGAFDPRAGCCGSAAELTDGVLGASLPCTGGAMEAECAALLREYFRDKRR